MRATQAGEVWAAAPRDLATFATYLGDPYLVLRGRGVLVISGGPTADFNIAMLEASADDDLVLPPFLGRVREAGVQASLMLSGANSARLATVARDEGLSEAGGAPLMLQVGSSVNGVGSDTFSVEHVADPSRLVMVADLVAAAFGLDRAWVGHTFAAPSLL